MTLVRTTLVAVHQANITGNYSVLRDLAAPDFRDKNSPADLAQIFAPIRQRKIDLAPVVLLDLQIARATLNDRKMLDVVGALATKPVPVRFELVFEPVDGVWRIDGIAITPTQDGGSLISVPATNTQAAASRSAPPRSAPKKKPRRQVATPLAPQTHPPADQSPGTASTGVKPAE